MMHPLAEPDNEANPTGASPRALSARLRRLARLVLDRRYRYSVFMQRGWVKDAFQFSNNTRASRYPTIFDFVQSVLGEHSRPTLLSFGCSTGEEVFDLCRRFPGARVRGLDINPGNVDICRRRLRQRRLETVSFARASSTRGEPVGAYDAIFCMAVLRDGRLSDGQTPDCSALIRFDTFASLVEDFHKRLKIGGLLIIRHCNFRLCDAPIGDRFEVIFSLPVPEEAPSPIYGPDNRLSGEPSHPDTVFRKIA